VIRGVKGVVIGQLLVSIIGLGELFELYSRNFLMEEFWALTLIVFAFALGIAELIAILERKIDFYAGVRHG
jgi:NitT/TauT family transport system permease protein